jgi:hypothetical protein
MAGFIGLPVEDADHRSACRRAVGPGVHGTERIECTLTVIAGDLEAIGFETEPFGPRTLAVKAAPAALPTRVPGHPARPTTISQPGDAQQAFAWRRWSGMERSLSACRPVETRR